MGLLWSLASIEVSIAQKLVLHHADKTTTDVELYLQPKVTFENNKVIITSTVLNMEFPKENVLRFTFAGSTNSIMKIDHGLKYSQQNGRLVFHGVSSKDKIAVYTASGIRVPVNVTISGDETTLPLTAIPSGVYLLSVNGKTSKFSKP